LPYQGLHAKDREQEEQKICRMPAACLLDAC
jgi:hypothetical protein